MMSDGGQVQIFKSADGDVQLEVNLERDTVWLTQRQMSDLFGKDVRTINEHVSNIYTEQELTRDPTVRKYRIVQQEGKRSVKREVEHYNLDVIISVGYRVKSQRGVQFRQWATNILKKHLVDGYTFNEKRLNQLGVDVDQVLVLLSRTLENRQLIDKRGQAVLEEPTKLEAIADGLPAGMAMTVIAASSGGIAAALLPLLGGALANSRYKARIERTLLEIATRLKSLEGQLRNITDENYQLLNNLIVVCLQTANERKLKMLANAVENSIIIEGISDFDSAQMSRIISEISADEVLFLLNLDPKKEIEIDNGLGETDMHSIECTIFKDDSVESEMVRNLFAVGVFKRGVRTWGQLERYAFTRVCGKLRQLLDGSGE